MKVKLPWKNFNGYLSGIEFENSESKGNVPKRSLMLLQAQFGDKLIVEEENENPSEGNTTASKKVKQPRAKKTNKQRRKKGS